MPADYDNKPRHDQADDEIDVAVLLNQFKLALKGVLNAIASFFQFILRNLALILTIMVLGSIAGYTIYYFTRPYYASSMTLVLADIPNQFAEEQLNRLAGMVADENRAAVAAALQVPTAAAAQVKQMTVTSLRQDRDATHRNLTMTPFRIELQLYDKSLFKTLDTAVTNYLESNPYFVTQKQIRQQQLGRMIAKLYAEIASIDSIKTKVAVPAGPVGGILYKEPLDPSRLYRESINMYQSKVELEAELDRLAHIQVAVSFSPQDRPTGPNLIRYLLIGDLVAFILGLMVALWLEASRKKKLS